jgi:hypothetical protein
VAAIGGGAAAYVTLSFIVDGVNQDTFLGIMLQGLVAGAIGLIVVIALYRLSQSKELLEIAKSLKIRFVRSPQSDS